MTLFTEVIIATLLISLISLSGAIFLIIGREKIKKILFFVISFSAGSLMGGAFFHLIPESLEKAGDPLEVSKLIIAGFILFYIIERVLRWHHCHDEHCETHKIIGYQNLLGDGVHNFLDGLIIASSFFVDRNLGVVVTISVALHEIPQEISDFGVLLYSGFSQSRAIFYNLLSALFAVLGAILGFLAIERVETIAQFLLPFAAGGFIYISASDMIPELHKEKSFRKSFIAFIFFMAAILMMLFLAE
jgi:zinc and cadmium transporter